MDNVNLHDIDIVSAESSEDGKQKNNNIITPEIECYFKDIENIVCEKISKADVVIGCVAWLTNKHIIDSLRKVKHGVSIIVQKEDFLRPDTKTNTKQNLYDAYTSIKPYVVGLQKQVKTNTIVDTLSTNSISDSNTSAIRCVGNYNVDKKISWPRMHNKFLIFCKHRENDEDGYTIKPYAVWTGSLNMTETSMRSFENGVCIKNRQITKAYLNEWAQIFALSEPLNWEKDWCAPEFRIGT